MEKGLKGLKWQNFLFLLVAGCINAFGVTVFLALAAIPMPKKPLFTLW